MRDKPMLMSRLFFLAIAIPLSALGNPTPAADDDEEGISLRSLLREMVDRDRLARFPVGQRAYVGYRILVQNGFRSRNLSGGYQTYLHVTTQVDRLKAEDY